MVSVIASNVRKGNVIEKDGKLYVVIKAENIHPGKGTPVTQLEMRRISDGVKVNERYKTTDQLEKAFIDSRTYNYLYQDGDHFVFMEPKSFRPGYRSDEEVMGDAAAYLTENMEVLDQHVQRRSDLDRTSAARDLGSGGNRACDEGPDRVGLVQARAAVQRRAHHGADTYPAGRAHRGADGRRLLRRAREGLSCVAGGPAFFLDEGAALQFVNCLAKLCLGVHHDGPVPRYRLLDWLAGDQQETDAFIAGLNSHLIAAVE